MRESDISALIERNKDTVCKIAYCYMNNIYDVEDIFQTVFKKYIVANPEFQNEKHEKAWFARVTINECKNYNKSSWKSKVVLAESDEAFSNTGKRAEYFSEANEAKVKYNEDITDEEIAVITAIKQLPEKYRVVIHLFYYEEYSVVEIAKILKVTKATVKMRLNRARNMIKERFE